MGGAIGDENWKSALVVPVPEAEYLIGPWRARHTHDGSFGMVAHATVLHPFHAPADLDDALPGLRDLAAAFERFGFELPGCARFDGGILYLRPEPAERFLELIEAAKRRYPQFPPYDKPGLEIVPHVTVATSDDAALLDRVEAQIGAALPIRALALDLWLVERRPEGWALRNRLPLGTAG